MVYIFEENLDHEKNLSKPFNSDHSFKAHEIDT